MARGRKLVHAYSKPKNACPLCEFESASKTAMRLHEKKTHPGFKFTKPIKVDDAICGICSERFPSKHQLNTHCKQNPTHNL